MNPLDVVASGTSKSVDSWLPKAVSGPIMLSGKNTNSSPSTCAVRKLISPAPQSPEPSKDRADVNVALPLYTRNHLGRDGCQSHVEVVHHQGLLNVRCSTDTNVPSSLKFEAVKSSKRELKGFRCGKTCPSCRRHQTGRVGRSKHNSFLACKLRIRRIQIGVLPERLNARSMANCPEISWRLFRQFF